MRELDDPNQLELLQEFSIGTQAISPPSIACERPEFVKTGKLICPSGEFEDETGHARQASGAVWKLSKLRVLMRVMVPARDALISAGERADAETVKDTK